MGMPGIDWRRYGKWARSQMSSMTLIYGGKKTNDNVYNVMEACGLIATSTVAVA